MRIQSTVHVARRHSLKKRTETPRAQCQSKALHCTALQQPKHRPSIPSVFSAQPPASSPGLTGNNPGRPKHPCSQNQKLGNTAYHIKTGRCMYCTARYRHRPYQKFVSKAKEKSRRGKKKKRTKKNHSMNGRSKTPLLFRFRRPMDDSEI